MSAEIYALRDVEELFSHERELMALLQRADHQHTELAEKAKTGLAKAQTAMKEAEAAVAKFVQSAPPGKQWPQHLDLPNPELCKVMQPSESIVSLAELGRQIREIEANMRGVWPPSFTQLAASQEAKLAEAAARLHNGGAAAVQDALAQCPPQPTSGVALIPQSLLLLIQQLSALGAKQDIAPVTADIAGSRAQLAALTKQEVHQVAVDADAVSKLKWAKVQAQTRVIDSLRRIVHAIETTEDESRSLRSVGDIRATAQQMSASMKEPHWRLKIQCEAALRNVQGSLRAMEAADVSDAALFASRTETSQQKLAANVQRQGEIWKQMGALLQELGALTLEKSGQVQTQIEAAEREERRRESHKWGLEVAEEHTKLLNQNIASCDVALACVDAADEFVASGLDVASAYHETSTRDLAAQKATLLVEIERELAALTAFTNDHRTFVRECMALSPPGALAAANSALA